MKELLNECRMIYKNRKKHFNLFDRVYNKLKKPNWMIKENDRRFESIYDEQDLLYSHGRIVLAHLVQANTLLFEPGKDDCPACIVFSEDTYFDENIDEMSEIANNLYILKDTAVEDLELKEFADVITDQMTALYNVQLPNSITNNKLVYYTTIMVKRSHLPNQYLKLGWFPILVCPEKTKASIILPCKYWSTKLIKMWQD
jgi:hypothetical protein